MKKRVISFLLLTVMLMSLFSTIAFAEIYSGSCGETVYWSLDYDTGLLTITGMGEMDDFYYAPWNQHASYVKTCVVNNGVTTIGKYAFENCVNLESITLPTTLVSISSQAFVGCSSLESISLPSSFEKIGSYAFKDCTSLSTVYLPLSITSIGDYAFYYCSSLKDVLYAGSQNEWKNVSIGLYNTPLVNKVRMDIIKGKCGSSLNLSLTRSLKTLTIDGSGEMNDYYSGYAAWYDYRFELEKVIINGGSSVGAWAFEDCSFIKEIVLSDSVSFIGYSAFDDCIALEKITIPEKMSNIGNYAFSDCVSLKEIIYTGSEIQWREISLGNNNDPLTKITSFTASDFSFKKDGDTLTVSADDTIPDYEQGAAPWKHMKSQIKNLVISNSVLEIGVNAFSDFSALENITLPENLTQIGSYAFQNCTSLTTVEIPTTVKSIGIGAFENASALSSVEFAALPSAWNEIFIEEKNAPLVNASLNANTWSFDETEGTLTISGIGAVKNYSVTPTPWHTFNDSIINVVIEDGITTIGESAFADCNSLETVRLPATVSEIRNSAFLNCDSLYLINYTGDESDAEKLKIGTGNTSFKKADFVFMIGEVGYFYDESAAVLTITGTGKMPDFSSNVATPWYSYASSIKEVVIEDGITHIGSSSFRLCTGITKATVSDSVLSIGAYAFSGCSRLIDLTLGAGVTVIDNYAFNSCNFLMKTRYNGSSSDFSKIKIGTNNQPLTSDITYLGDVVNWEFDQAKKTLTIYGVGMMGNYATASNTPWYVYKDAVEKIVILDGITTVGSSSFRFMPNLTEITLPESITKISDSAFSGSDKLSKIIYQGTKTAYKKITVESLNAPFESAQVVYMKNSIDYIYDNATKTLYIEGSGPMENYSTKNPVEWKEYRAYAEHIVISEDITTIGDYSFYSFIKVKEITLSDNITYIGINAFSSCSMLEKINIPSSVHTLGDYAVYLTNIKTIEVPASVTTIGYSVFAGDKNLTEIVVSPQNMNYVSVDGILYDKNKKTIISYPAGKSGENFTVPSTVTAVDGTAFFGCKNLKTLIIPDNVTTVNMYAFWDCSVETLSLGEKVSFIGEGCFYNCPNLKTIKYNNTEEEFNKIQVDIMNDLLASVEITYKVPDTYSWEFNENSGSLTITGTGALPDFAPAEAPWTKHQNSIYNINIGEGITEIGDWAFAYCYYARMVNLPQTLDRIGTNAFYYCINLEEAIIPDSVTTLGQGAFSYCRALESVSIPADLQRIYNYTFYDCPKLSYVYFTETLTKWNAVNKGTGNENLLSAEVKTDTKAGTTWSYKNGTLTISGNARMVNYTARTTPWSEHTDNIKKIVVEEGVTGIGNYAFGYCYYATEVSLPDSLVHIGSNAFYNCLSLENIDLPEGVRRIYGGAFYNCKKLDNITIPAKVDKIYKYTFDGCNSLTDISYNGTKVQWEKIDILDNNTPLVNAQREYLVKSIEWNLSKDGTLTIGGGAAMDDYELNKTPMAPWAEVREQVKKVVIEDGIPNIGKNAFYGCTSLTEIVIPESVTSIGYGAFMSTSLKKISIPSSVTYIGSSAFNGCALLTEVNVPAGVTNIYSYTFYNCKRLNKVTLDGDKANINIVATGNEYFTALIG